MVGYLGGVRQQYVFWFQVSVDDALSVKIGEAAYHLSENNSTVQLLNKFMAIDEGDKITSGCKLCENVSAHIVNIMASLSKRVRFVAHRECGEITASM